MQGPGYEKKVPESVRAANAQRLEELRTQLAGLETAAQEIAALQS